MHLKTSAARQSRKRRNAVPNYRTVPADHATDCPCALSKAPLPKKPVVPSATSRVRRLTETMRLYLRPLGVRQYITIHPQLESQLRSIVNPHSP